MSGKPNEAMFKTMVAKHGSEEAAREWYRYIGRQGGTNSRNGGFAYMKAHGQEDKIKAAGSRGGKVSKRTAVPKPEPQEVERPKRLSWLHL